MKQNVKNGIVIALIVLICGAIAFTMSHAESYTTTNSMQNTNEMGQPPDMGNNENNMGTPPEKPEDDSLENGENNTNPQPEIPGSNNGGTPPNMNSNSNPELSDVYYILLGVESLILALLVMSLIMSKGNKKSLKQMMSNSDKIVIFVLSSILFAIVLTYVSGKLTNKFLLSNNSNDPTIQGNNKVTYSAIEEITEDIELEKGTYSSSTKDENALLVNGDIEVTLSNIEVNKSGNSDSGDSTSFYGNNSAILAKEGADLTLNNVTVTTNASGANGVFSYGGSATMNNTSSDGTTIMIRDSKITTTGDTSGGIMTTGGGILNAYNLDITTAGTSSAAIRTDRGGGTVIIDGGAYTTTGQGSPSIYSTADVTVSNATLVAKASEGIVIEGANKVTIKNCDLTDSNTKLNGMSTTYKNIFLYQSMSGDASMGTAQFIAKNSKITTNNGDSFYITNTTATITLEDNTIVNNDSKGNFLRVQKDSWGNDGSNGGDVALDMKNQKSLGNIIIDSISTLNMTMSLGSYYEGSINTKNEAKSIKLKLDETSQIKLTGNSYVSALDNSKSDNSNIEFNGYKLYVNGKEIN